MVDYEYICYRCGFALTKYDVGSFVEGRFVSFLERDVGDIRVFFCIECTKIMEEIAISGMEGAIKRVENLKEMDIKYNPTQIYDE